MKKNQNSQLLKKLFLNLIVTAFSIALFSLVGYFFLKRKMLYALILLPFVFLFPLIYNLKENLKELSDLYRYVFCKGKYKGIMGGYSIFGLIILFIFSVIVLLWYLQSLNF